MPLPRTSRTAENVYAVEAHVFSQENRPGAHIIPQISREIKESMMETIRAGEIYEMRTNSEKDPQVQ